MRREKKSSPGIFFLLVFDTKRILTRQEISPLSRLTSHLVVGPGVVLSRLASPLSLHLNIREERFDTEALFQNQLHRLLTLRAGVDIADPYLQQKLT